MSNLKLSDGALATIMTGGNVDMPIMQVLGIKKIVGSAEKERFRLLVSDGKYQISFAMIATQINEKITSGDLSNNSVIKVKKFITSMINSGGKGDRRVMVILEMDILARGDDVGGKLGNPVQLPDDPSTVLKHTPTPAAAASSNGTSKSAASTTTASSSTTTTIAPKAAPIPTVPKPTSTHTENIPPPVDSHLIVPIANLSPYQNRWVIKARVTNKSGIRTWNNSRGEGKLFSIDLADESGEIRATLFRDLVDKFESIIEIDKVYYISKCQIKSANRQYCNLDNDYEMTFNNETTVTPCLDEMSVPKTQYKFITIDQIAQQEANSIIDAIGVCKSWSDLQTIRTKSTNRELVKRELTLVDQSKTSVVLTLWGKEAEEFAPQDKPVIAVRGAKVGEFGGGKNLSVLVNSIMKTNPDLPEAHRLRGWFDNEGRVIDATNISARSVTGGAMKTDWMTIAEVKEKKMGSDQAEYYQLKGTILLVNSNNALYKACPVDDCNKKVVDLQNGQYRCEKCNQEHSSFKYRLIMSCNIGDWSDNQWVSMFASEAEKILGQTSQQIGEKTENDKDSLIQICGKANFSEFLFRCRTKMENYNDESRLKSVVLRADPVNFKEYMEFLHSSITKTLAL